MRNKRSRKTLGATVSGSIEEEEARISASRAGSSEPQPPMSNPAVERAKEAIRDEDRHATRLIPTNQVRMSPISDRINPEEDLESLIESIRENGQKVPILVRQMDEGDFEVIYGRRRLFACRALNIQVRASVMKMNDEDALIAQGIENNERLDTSFIERALFAHRIREAGFEVSLIQKIMGVHETLARKMRAIAAGIPEDLILRIGPAPDSGRRQWDELRRLCEALGPSDAERLCQEVDTGMPSSDRLSEIILIASGVPKDLLRAISPVPEAHRLQWDELIAMCARVDPDRLRGLANALDPDLDPPLRMKQALLIGSGIPSSLVLEIGLRPEPAAHLWDRLREVCERIGPEKAEVLVSGIDTSPDLGSPQRLMRLLAHVDRDPGDTTNPEPSGPSTGLDVKRSGRRFTLVVPTPKDKAFLSFLEGRITDLYEEWKGGEK